MINPSLQFAHVRQRNAELQESRRHGSRPPAQEPVTVRVAGRRDARRIRRIAGAEGAVPASPVLIGEIAGSAIAALSLVDGALVAGGQATAEDVVALLRLRAAQLRRLDAQA